MILNLNQKNGTKKNERKKSNRKNKDNKGSLLIGTINIQQPITLVMLYNNNGQQQ